LKYDEIYFNEHSSISELRKGINRYMNFIIIKRFHSALGCEKPMNVSLRGVEKSA
jgi:putative transposase